MQCGPAPMRRLVKEDFKGALGAFTPCFTDIVILGAMLEGCSVTCRALLFVRRIMTGHAPVHAHTDKLYAWERRHCAHLCRSADHVQAGVCPQPALPLQEVPAAGAAFPTHPHASLHRRRLQVLESTSDLPDGLFAYHRRMRPGAASQGRCSEACAFTEAPLSKLLWGAAAARGWRGWCSAAQSWPPWCACWWCCSSSTGASQPIRRPSSRATWRPSSGQVRKQPARGLSEPCE